MSPLFRCSMYGQIGFAEYFVFYRVPLSNGCRDGGDKGACPLVSLRSGTNIRTRFIASFSV